MSSVVILYLWQTAIFVSPCDLYNFVASSIVSFSNHRPRLESYREGAKRPHTHVRPCVQLKSGNPYSMVALIFLVIIKSGQVFFKFRIKLVSLCVSISSIFSLIHIGLAKRIQHHPTLLEAVEKRRKR